MRKQHGEVGINEGVLEAPEETPVLVNLATKLQQAENRYNAAVSRLEKADAECKEAMDHLNEAQAALDEAYKVTRKGAPRGSDWALNDTSNMA